MDGFRTLLFPLEGTDGGDVWTQVHKYLHKQYSRNEITQD